MYDMQPSNRKLLQVWVRPTGIEKIDALAKDLKATRSDIVRECLAIALSDPGKIVDRIERKQQGL